MFAEERYDLALTHSLTHSLTVILRSLPRSLTARVAASLLVLFLIALLILATGLYLSGQLRQDAAGVDLAGSERMRTYKLSSLVHPLTEPWDAEPMERRAQMLALIEEEIRTFEAILVGLREGGPNYGLPAAPTGQIVKQIDAVVEQWHGFMKPRLRAGLDATSVEEARRSLAEYDARTPEFVGSIDEIVKELATHSSSKVAYLHRLGYVLLGVLLVVGVGTGYLLHRFTVRPVLEVVWVARAMGKGDLSQRVEGTHSGLVPQEVADLATAFNEMAEHVETSIRRVRAAGQLSRRILASLPDAVIVVGRGCEVRYANRVFSEWFAREPTAAVGRPLREVLPLADALEGIEAMVRGRVYGQPVEAIWSPEGGMARTFRITLSGLRLAEEVEVEVEVEEEEEEELVVIEELTLYRRMAEERQALQAQLIQAEKLSALGRLVAGVAHELNNPLTVVLGRAALLLGGEPDERTRRALESIRAQAERMGRIIKQLLTFARRYAPERKAIDLNALLRELGELQAYELAVANVEVQWELDPALAPTVADPHQLQQVFLNLMMNAVQAMGGRPGRLTIRTERVGHTLRASVADTGPGIVPEHLTKIFDPFFTTKEVGQGTGLGLSVCYSIVLAHGGRIWAESAPGRGATFVVELPLIPQTPGEAAELAHPAVPSLPRCRVLVVDDEEEICSLLAELLVREGHQVSVARNGEEALARLGRGPCDVILSDIRMPGLDGPALYRRLAAERPELLYRLVMLTGDIMGPETHAFLEETRLPHVAKPFTWDAVRAAIARVLGPPDVSG